MSVSTSRLSFTDCFDLLDKAVESNQGVKARFDTEGDARNYATRVNKARVLDRRENLNTYEEGDPLYGRSVYDPIMVQVRPMNGKWWLFLRKRSIDRMIVEPIEDEPVVEESAEDEPEPAMAAAPAAPTGIRRL